MPAPRTNDVAQACATVLSEIGAPELASRVLELFGARHGRTRPRLRHAASYYVDIAHRLVAAIAFDGGPRDTLYVELRKLHTEAQSRVEAEWSASTPSSGFDQEVLDALHYMGGLHKLSGGGGFSFFLIPEALPLALRLLSTLDAPARRKHMAEIASLRGQQLDVSHVRSIEDATVAPVAAHVQRRVRRRVAEALEWRVTPEELEAVQVEYLPTATDFYWAGIRYYEERPTTRRRYYIFATTSGVILPQERFGSDYWRQKLKIPALYETSGKNPIRQRYFQVLESAAGLERMYYFELERASAEYRKALEAIRGEAAAAGLDPSSSINSYKEDAVESIASFLRKPSFGLVEVAYFPRQYDYLTLGNGRATLLSGRDRGSAKKIGHGFMLTPKRGWLSNIRRWFSGEALLKDMIPRSAMRNPELDSGLLLASASVRAFIPVVLGAIRKCSRKRQEEGELRYGDGRTRV